MYLEVKYKNVSQWHGVSKYDFPGKNKIDVDITSEAVVIGYPFEFYDRVNKFPIVKSGIIASRWGSNFDGKPYFLVDANLFPGSSGSIVISRPTNFAFDEGNSYQSETKQFAFLGRCCMNSIGCILVECCFLVSCFFLPYTTGVCPDGSCD